MALALLLSGVAVYESIHLSVLNAPEVWVHLRTGSWMIEHHAPPRAGLFSQYPSLRWNDTRWGFDLLLGMSYRIFDFACATDSVDGLEGGSGRDHVFAGALGGAGFWWACGLSMIAQYVIAGFGPLPYGVSNIFLAIELRLLLSSRSSGSLR